MVKVYWVTGTIPNRIFYADINDLSIPTAPSNIGSLTVPGNIATSPTGISIDVSNNNIYLSNCSNSRIYSVHVDDLQNPTLLSNSTLLTNPDVISPNDVFLDAINQNIYWFNNTSPPAIWVGQVNDLTNPSSVINRTKLLSIPSGFGNALFVNTNNGKIYWGHGSGAAAVALRNTVWVGQLDPLATPTSIISSDLIAQLPASSNLTSIFIDLYHDKIYLGDSALNRTVVASISSDDSVGAFSTWLSGTYTSGMQIVCRPPVISNVNICCNPIKTGCNFNLCFNVVDSDVLFRNKNLYIYISDILQTSDRFSDQNKHCYCLTAPSTMSDYLLTIYAVDELNTTISDTELQTLYVRNPTCPSYLSGCGGVSFTPASSGSVTISADLSDALDKIFVQHQLLSCGTCRCCTSFAIEIPNDFQSLIGFLDRSDFSDGSAEQRLRQLITCC